MDGVEEEEDVGAWLRRCWMASTEEEDEGRGGQIDEGRDGGREEGASEGGSDGGAAFAVATPPLGLCVVGCGKGGRRGSNMRQNSKEKLSKYWYIK